MQGLRLLFSLFNFTGRDMKLACNKLKYLNEYLSLIDIHEYMENALLLIHPLSDFPIARSSRSRQRWMQEFVLICKWSKERQVHGHHLLRSELLGYISHHHRRCIGVFPRSWQEHEHEQFLSHIQSRYLRLLSSFVVFFVPVADVFLGRTGTTFYSAHCCERIWSILFRYNFLQSVQ